MTDIVCQLDSSAMEAMKSIQLLLEMEQQMVVMMWIDAYQKVSLRVSQL